MINMLELMTELEDVKKEIDVTVKLLKGFQFPKSLFSLKKYITQTDKLVAKLEKILKKYGK